MAQILASITQWIVETNYVLTLIKTLFIVGIVFLLNSILKIYFKRIVHISIKNKPAQERRAIGTRLKILRRTISVVLFSSAIIVLLFLIPGVRALSVSLLAGAGIAAIVIGFAAQKTISDIISGLSIAIYAPFRIGDKIKILQENGDVEDINLRHTIIRTWDNKRIVIPNSVIADREVINYSLKDEKMLFTIEVGISYNADIEKARAIMIKLAEAHPENLIFEEKDQNGEIIKKGPYVRTTSLGTFAVNLTMYFWVSDNSKGFKMRDELLEQIKLEFDKQGIELPYPYNVGIKGPSFKKQVGPKKSSKKKLKTR